MGIKEDQRGTGNTLVATEPKPNAEDNPLISTGNWHHNARHTQSAKAKVLCTAAIAKSNSEDNPVQRIMATGAVADFQEVSI